MIDKSTDHSRPTRFLLRVDLRGSPSNGFNPAVRRRISVDLYFKQPLKPASSIGVTPELDTPSGPRLLLSVDQASQPIALNNASVGNNLIVVPVLPLSHGINYRRTFPQLILSKTAQGLVIEPKIDDLRVRSIRKGLKLPQRKLCIIKFNGEGYRVLIASGSITRVLAECMEDFPTPWIR